jgi:hypothetical protein
MDKRVSKRDDEMRSEDRLLRALFGEPRFWASYEEMAEAAEKLQAENKTLRETLSDMALDAEMSHSEIERLQRALDRA